MPYYTKVLLTFDAIMILATMVGAVALSVASWPSATMLAAREPAVKSLQKSSTVLKATTFALVLAAVAPASAAYADAKDAAAQQAQWKSLADQVVLSFPAGMGERGFQELMPEVGKVVQDAEARNAVALSYTWADDGPNELYLGTYRYLSLVNQRWLDLMATDGRGSQAKPGRHRRSGRQRPLPRPRRRRIIRRTARSW